MVLTETKKRKVERNEAIRKEFDQMEGMKGPKYKALAEKYGMSRISIVKIVLEGVK